jgi:probable rRNA maturation factor
VIAIEIHNDQAHMPLDEQRLGDAMRSILADQALSRALVSLVVVDDLTIRRLHREYLGKDAPTDVLSFPLEQGEGVLEGEVIVSAETAQRVAATFGWPVEDELLLYAIHGTLHLVGFDDDTPPRQAEMRRQERAYLAKFGLCPRYEECGLPAQGAATEEERVP